MTSASIAQVASATAALCGAAGVTYYAVNVAKVFGGARRGEGDANGRARAIEGGRGATLRTGERTRASARGGSIDARAREGVGTDDGRARARAGDPLPSTMTKEWEAATKARMKAWPREGSATPVVLEPMDK